ncbi:MAG: response regulator, partial [Holophagales bacterium]|nr:response regulator [Holophagales bacterium]
WASFGWEQPEPEALRGVRIAVPGEPISTMIETRAGELWAAGWNGLFRHQASGGWKQVQPASGDPLPAPIRFLRETADGALWLATSGQGIVRWQEGRATVIDRHHGLASNHLRAIWLAPEGHLWITTDDRGLSRLDPSSVGAPGGPRIVNVDRRHGLFTNGVHQIVDDELGNLWMSSNDGIFRVRRAELEAVADALGAGEPAKLVSISYDERDGMRSREANGGVQQSGLRDRSGKILFPTMGGVVRLDPRELTRPSEVPPIRIRSLRHGDSRRTVTNGDDLLLEPDQRSFVVSFTAPTFRAADRLRFRYRLVPYDDTWVEAGNRREAPYTKVPPGRWTLEVAVSAEGVWGEPASITLEAVPLFYETLWFRLLCGISGLALVFLWARRREHRERSRRLELETEVRERTATIRRQAEKLRELDELKSQFFANISHEFRTPLTLVLGPLRDALGGSFGSLDRALKQQLGVAEDNAKRVLGLVDQLLDVARLDAGGLRLRRQRLDLGDFLRLRIEALRPLAERLGVDIRLQAPARETGVAADPSQLAKVVDNLLTNALAFSPAGGTVDVLLELEGRHHLSVLVRDRGPGIPEHAREKVFERFHRLEATESRPGAGLGLALARQLTELHGGSLTVASPEEGSGACFALTLRRGAEPADSAPAAVAEPGAASVEQAPDPSEGPREPPLLGQAEVPAPEMAREMAQGTAEETAEEEARRSPGRARVLIADDHPEIRGYLRRHLGGVFDVLEAADGQQAFDLAREQPPELVISDIMMPGLDGNALFRELRRDPELETIPVILLTAKASADDRLQGLREGVDDYLVKPFDPRELRIRAENLIATRRKSQKPPRGLQVSEIEANPAALSFLGRVKSVIEQRIGDKDLNVEALADAVGCERSHLLRQLRLLTGETPSGLIRSMRMQRAAQLLRSQVGTVSEVAAQVGFKSAPHFSTTFFRHFGERPKAYAERHRPGE